MAKTNKNIGNEDIGIYRRLSYSRRYSAVVPSDEKRRASDGSSYELEMVDAPPKQPELIVNALAKYIVKSGMKPGDKLPAGRELSRILGVASCSLREALIILQTLGVIQARHGSGWYISRFDPSTSLHMLAPIVESFSGMEVYEIVETRIINEPKITRLAATNITPVLKKQLEDALGKMKETGNYDGTFRRYDRLFHDTLAQASGNRMLAMLSSILSGLYFSEEWWNVARYVPEDHNIENYFHLTLAEHQKIFDAIMAGDGETAESAMLDHITSGWNRIQGSLRKIEEMENH